MLCTPETWCSSRNKYSYNTNLERAAVGNFRNTPDQTQTFMKKKENLGTKWVHTSSGVVAGRGFGRQEHTHKNSTFSSGTYSRVSIAVSSPTWSKNITTQRNHMHVVGRVVGRNPQKKKQPPLHFSPPCENLTKYDKKRVGIYNTRQNCREHEPPSHITRRHKRKRRKKPLSHEILVRSTFLVSDNESLSSTCTRNCTHTRWNHQVSCAQL